MNRAIKEEEQLMVDVSVEVQLIKDGDFIVSYCPALELSSYGNTEEDARAGFYEALAIFMEELHEKGTLEKVLLNLGWSLRKLPVASFQPPSPEVLKLYPTLPIQTRFNERVSIPVY